MIDYDTYCKICGNTFHVTKPMGAYAICPQCRQNKNYLHLARKRKRLTIGAIKEINRKKGQYWFSPNTMRFFKSKVPDDHMPLVKNRFFISSEKSPWDKRKYTIREFIGKTGSVETFGEFQFYNSKESAQRVLKKLMEGKI